MLATPGPTELFVMLPFLLLGSFLVVLPFWRICTRAGLAGPWSLLMVVPLVNVIVLFYIAFTSWPALEGKVVDPLEPPPE